MHIQSQNGLWPRHSKISAFHPNATLDKQDGNTKTFMPQQAYLFCLIARPTNLRYLSYIEIQSPTPSRCLAAPCSQSKLIYRPQKTVHVNSMKHKT